MDGLTKAGPVELYERMSSSPGKFAGKFAGAFLSEVAMPVVTVVDPPVSIRLSGPTYAVLGQPFDVHVLLLNNTSALRTVSVSAAVAFPEARNEDAPFLLAGPTATSLTLPPNHRGKVSFRLVASDCGRHRLPYITVDDKAGDGQKPLCLGTGKYPLIFVVPERPEGWIAEAATEW
jgi:hypothetical protein